MDTIEMMNNENDDKLDSFVCQNEIKFIEAIDMDALELIRDNFDTVYPLLGKFKDIKNNYQYIIDKKVVKKLIDDRCRNTTNEFTYKYAARQKEGRLYSIGWSCQGMPKILRHTIAGKTNYDIDIKKCHPNIAYKTGVRLGIDMPCLNEYITNGDEFLGRYMHFYECDYDKAKTDILSLFNNQNFSGCTPSSPIYGLWNEIQLLQNKVIVVRKDIYKKLLDKGEQERNPKGKTMSLYLQSIENKLFQCMLSFCNNNDIEITAGCFDGFMATIETVDDYGGVDKLMRDIEKYVIETLDFSLELACKPMDKGINIEQLSKNIDDSPKEEEKKKDPFDILLLSDERCAKYVLKHLEKNEVIFYHKTLDQLYFYNEDNALFELKEKEHIMTYFSKLLPKYLQDIGANDKKNYDAMTLKAIITRKFSLESSAGQRAIFNCLKLYFTDKTKYIDKKFNKIPYLISLQDKKVVDIRTNNVRDRTKSDFFSYEINRDYNPDCNVERVKEFIRLYIILREKVELDEQDKLTIENFLMVCGYLLTGYNNLKKIFLMIGKPNTGKSSLFNNKIFRFFSDFFAQVNKRVFVKNKNDSVHDAEDFELINRRVVSVGELDDNEKFNNSKIKFISGDDKILPMRPCGSTKIYKAIVDCKIILPLNGVPTSVDAAFLSRVISFKFMNVFDKSDMTPERNELINTIDDDLFSTMVLYAHLFYKNKLTIEWSESVLDCTKEVVSQVNNIKDFYNKNFSYSDNRKDRISKKDIYDLYNEQYGHSMGKIQFYRAFESELTLLDVYRRTHYCYIKYLVNKKDIDDDENIDV
jgi:hypothetical protein